MAIEREFKAKITKDFKRKWLEATAEFEDLELDDAKFFYDNDDLDLLSQRIDDSEVVIVEHRHPVGESDFFEKEDNSYIIHQCLFNEI